MDERWLPVVGYEDIYSVSDHGRVRRDAPNPKGSGRAIAGVIRNGRVLPNGYCQIDLSKNNQAKAWYVHTLVLMAFHGPRPDGMEACHYDGVRTNNKASNLRWDTRVANRADQRRHGTIMLGERNHAAKLTLDAVQDIRDMHRNGVLRRTIADKHSVSRAAIDAILYGRAWAWSAKIT